MAFERDFTIWAKGANWGGDSELVQVRFYGEDQSAAALKWVFYDPADRSTKITLTHALAGAEGILRTYDAAAVHPDRGDVVGLTTFYPLITEATLETLTFPSTTADLVLAHTLYCTPVGKLQFVLCVGTLTIKQGGGD